MKKKPAATDPRIVPNLFPDWPSLARHMGEQCSGPCGPQPCVCAQYAERLAVYIETLEAAAK